MGNLVHELKELMAAFFREEDAVGVIEMILILVVLIGLVLIFKDQLTQMVQTLLSKVAGQVSGI